MKACRRVLVMMALAGVMVVSAASPVIVAAAPRVFRAIGINGNIVSSGVSQDAADSLAQAQWLANPAYVSAGDYMGFDATPRLTNPADMTLIYGPTKRAAEASARAWGTELVRGGVWLATSFNGLAVVVSSVSAKKARSIAVNSGPGGASLKHATSSTGQVLYSPSSQQWADNLAAYQHVKARPVPTSPEVCFHGSKLDRLTLLSWQCPANWQLLKAAA